MLAAVIGIENAFVMIPEDGVTSGRRGMGGLISISKFSLGVVKPNTELRFPCKSCREKHILTIVDNILPFVAVNVLSCWGISPVIA